MEAAGTPGRAKVLHRADNRRKKRASGRREAVAAIGGTGPPGDRGVPAGSKRRNCLLVQGGNGNPSDQQSRRERGLGCLPDRRGERSSRANNRVKKKKKGTEVGGGKRRSAGVAEDGGLVMTDTHNNKKGERDVEKKKNSKGTHAGKEKIPSGLLEATPDCDRVSQRLRRPPQSRKKRGG